MNLDEYERIYFGRYQLFAEVIRNILDRAIAAAGDLPRPQSIQARAKTPDSLRKRLEEAGQLNADVAVVRRDLAGVRLIFYTNNEVDRFLNSSTVFDNFAVDRNATKIHHPVKENGEVQYRAIHYTVSLNEARAALPEYKDFAGLRCEIQIQTILIHAWAETSHDIIYKADDRQGFGNAALDQIKKRFNRIMDKYLVPAGYEFQRVQQDYERLVAGKTLFDQNLLESLKKSQDNNERYEHLASLADDLLPLYDDLPAVFVEVLDVLVDAVEAARETPDKPIETPFSTYDGHTAAEITYKTVEVIDAYRYAAVEKTFTVLQRIFAGETDDQNRKRILETVSHLARYDLKVWKQAGPAVQQRLAAVIDNQKNISAEVRPLIIEVWRHLLDAEATGTTWTYEAVSWEAGEVPIMDVYTLRQTAIEALFELFRTAVNDGERREVFQALDNATRTAARGSPSNAFLRESLSDHARIVRFLTDEAETISYELRESIEDSALYDFYRVSDLLGTKGAAMGCLLQATELAEAIIAMRDRFNEDETFVRYKILVGFEGVMPQQWDDHEFDHQKVDAYRDERIDEFLEEVTEQTKADWLILLERCASTKSNDAATFSKLGEFVVKLSERKPVIADFLLSNGNGDLLRFVPPFLNGLFKSQEIELYRKNLHELLARPGHFGSIAIHWRASKPDDPDTLQELLVRSIKARDRYAVAECAVYAIRNFPHGVPPNAEFFRPAMLHLIEAKDTNWIRQAWLPEKTPFFENLDVVDAGLITDSLIELPKVSYDAERILSFVSTEHLGLVWDYFGRRLAHPREQNADMRYEAAPHRFQLLAPRLAIDARLAVEKAHAWYQKDSSLYGYRGGRVLSIAFPQCPGEFVVAMVEVIRNGDSDDVEFVLDVMQNYHGESTTHPILKEVIAKFPDDERKKSGVARSIENTGVVRGEFGFVENLRGKKALVAPWLEDENPAVAEFAHGLIAELDRDILQEKRRADTRSALHKLDYEPLEDDSNSDGEN